MAKKRIAGRNMLEALVAGNLSFATDLDRRSSGYKRFAAVTEAIGHDLGGVEQLSTLQRRLLQHCAALSVYLEQQEAALLRGEPLENKDLYVSGLNAFRRLATSLGWQRIPKDAGPAALQDYLKMVAKQNAAASEQTESEESESYAD